MTQPTTAPAKKVELSAAQRLQNILFGMGAGYYMVGAAWWYIGLCRYQWAKYKRLPGPPVTIELFGSDPEQGRDILTEYGIRSAYGLLQWAVVENKVGLRLMFLVSQANFDYADNILSQYEGQTFAIISNAGNKRGQSIRKPYAQRQPRRQAQPARKARQVGQALPK